MANENTYEYLEETEDLMELFGLEVNINSSSVEEEY